MSSKSRKAFTDKLYAISDGSQFKSNYERYLAMGQGCNLIDYFSGSEKLIHSLGVSYFFIALNVEAPAVESGVSPIIPFFSIIRNNCVDDPNDRSIVLNTAQNAINDDFLTCPDFMNGENGIRTLIEKIVFKFSVKGGKIEKNSISIIDISSVDDNEVKTEEGNSLIENFLNSSKKYKETFFDSWSVPIGKGDKTIYCSVRAVDRDKEYKSHSIFVAMSDKLDALKNWVPKYGEDAMNIIATLKRIFIEDMKKRQRAEAIKSAKAAIMSRNMSHNLGSHVMSYLKQHLGTVKDMINDKILSELVDGELDLTKTLDKNVDTIALPFLLGLGHFISYLQERQDFIATIATDYIPYYSTINFKDDIYDVLNPDKRAERHPERDKTSNMKMDNILLGNIARSEGLGRPTRPTEIQPQTNGIAEKLGDIVLRFGKYFNGNAVKKDSKEEIDLREMRGVNFSVPGGIVGRQAVFSILENITRNAAKHGKWHKSGKLQLTFNVYDRWADIPVDDNDDGDLSLKEVFENFYFGAIDKDDLFYVTVTDNCEICAEDLAKLRIALQDEYIDYATGVMKDGNKGLKEMRISSAWIRSLRDESVCYSPAPRYNDKDTDEKKKKIFEDLKHDKGWSILNEESKMIAPLLYARIRALRINNVVRNRNLQYVFCVPKTRKVAIISDSSFGEKVNMRLINNCWRAFTKEEFENEPNKSFEFILCDETDVKNDSGLYNIIRPIASSRVYKLSQIEDIDRASFIADVCNLVSSNDDYKKKLSLYEELLYKKLSSFVDGDLIRIEDDRAKDGVAHEGNEQEDEIIIGNVVLSGTPHSGKYIYRTHHEAYSLFEKFMNIEHSETIFVEGISGNNSTDRLIRNEVKNSIWFYRHLHAIKQQVAVFDERLYSRIGLKSSEDFSKDHIAITYLQRGVYVFTLVEDQNSETNSFGLYGISLSNGNPILGEQYKCLCGRLATLTYNKTQGLVVEPTNGGAYILCKFDFISIHQGLLDKLYHTFGIKKQMLNQVVNKEKIRLTNQFYLYFSNSVKELYTSNQEKWINVIQGGIVEPWNDGFIPGFVIHSGRSKPGENDMPQQLPFLQYAAIEHAILDCKYSLVELLDYARYEK